MGRTRRRVLVVEVLILVVMEYGLRHTKANVSGDVLS